MDTLNDPAARNLDPDCTTIFDENAMNVCTGSDGEVQPVPDSVKIAERGRDTDTLVTIARSRTDAC